MKSVRITIAGMLGAVSLCGVAFGALSHPNPWAASAFLTATFGVLLLSVLGALFSHRGRCAFWTGFALFGWVYGLVNLGVGFGAVTSQQLVTTQGLNRLYTSLHPRPAVVPGSITLWTVPGPDVVINQQPNLNWIPNLNPANAYPAQIYLPGNGPFTYSPACPTCGIVNASVYPEPFLRIGQSLTTLLVGLIGGIAAVIVWARANRHDRHHQDTTSSPIALKESLRSV